MLRPLTILEFSTLLGESHLERPPRGPHETPLQINQLLKKSIHNDFESKSVLHCILVKKILYPKGIAFFCSSPGLPLCQGEKEDMPSPAHNGLIVYRRKVGEQAGERMTGAMEALAEKVSTCHSGENGNPGPTGAGNFLECFGIDLRTSFLYS